MKPEINTTLYRYIDPPHRFDGVIEEPVLTEYRVIGRTRSGLWVQQVGMTSGRKRWMKWPAVRPFARPSKADAMESWKARKYQAVRHLDYNLNRARALVRSFDPDWFAEGGAE